MYAYVPFLVGSLLYCCGRKVLLGKFLPFALAVLVLLVPRVSRAQWVENLGGQDAEFGMAWGDPSAKFTLYSSGFATGTDVLTIECIINYHHRVSGSMEYDYDTATVKVGPPGSGDNGGCQITVTTGFGGSYQTEGNITRSGAGTYAIIECEWPEIIPGEGYPYEPWDGPYGGVDIVFMELPDAWWNDGDPTTQSTTQPGEEPTTQSSEKGMQDWLKEAGDESSVEDMYSASGSFPRLLNAIRDIDTPDVTNPRLSVLFSKFTELWGAIDVEFTLADSNNVLTGTSYWDLAVQIDNQIAEYWGPYPAYLSDVYNITEAVATTIFAVFWALLCWRTFMWGLQMQDVGGVDPVAHFNEM